jgi:DNA-binding MurR/RpiR family transcriptional regulator
MPAKDKRPTSPTPKNYEGIVNLITREYPHLSAGFQQIARFFTQNPNIIALESINSIAAQCGTHPSSLVRFAQNFGYSGFKQLQAVFQTRLATAAPGFRERLSALESELSRNEERGNLGICGNWLSAISQPSRTFSKGLQNRIWKPRLGCW